MSIKILSKEFRYFDNLLGTPKDFLIGNIGDPYYCKMAIRYAVDKEYTLASSLITGTQAQASGSNFLKLTNSDATQWNSIGFKVGDTAVLKWTQYLAGSATLQTKAGIVDSIAGDEMVLNVPPFASHPLAAPSTDDGAGNYLDNVYIFSVNVPEQVILKAFHTTNRNNRSAGSFIDSTAPSIKFDAVDSITVGQSIAGTLTGDQSGAGLFGPTKIRLTGGNIRHKFYEIEFNNHILPYASQNDLANNTAPPHFAGPECLTDRFIVEGRPDKNNPNVRSSTAILETLGNTGYFNENFNGQKTAMTASISYADEATGVALSQLNSAGNTDITITVSGLTAFNGLHGLGFALIPNDLGALANSKDAGHEQLNMMRANAISINAPVLPQTLQGYGDLPMGYKDLDIQQAGTDIVLTATLVPSAALKAYLDTAGEDDKKYIIWMSTETGALDIADSDKTSLLADYNTLQEYIAPVGAWGHDIDILNRNQVTTEDQILCELDLKIEDNIIVKSNFLIGSIVPDSLIYKVVAYNSTTLQSFELDKIEVDLTQFPTVGNALQINYIADRLYKTANSDLTTISIQRNAALDSGSSFGYTALIPARIRYEDWIARVGVPADFYDTAEGQNGLNNDWYHYSSTAGWSVRIVLNTDVLNGTTTDRYEDYRVLGFNDYDQNSIITSSFEYFIQSSGAQLTGGTDAISGKPLGAILNNDVRVECTFVRSSGTWSNLTNVYAVMRIEDNAGAGHLSQHEIVTDEAPLNASALQPLTGETGLKIELINSTTIKVSTLVKPSNLATAERYKITARIGCK